MSKNVSGKKNVWKGQEVRERESVVYTKVVFFKLQAPRHLPGDCKINLVVVNCMFLKRNKIENKRVTHRYFTRS